MIFDRTTEHIGPAGFSAEPDRKLAWLCNKFVLGPEVTLPSTAPGDAVAGGHSYTAIGAVRAYSELITSRAASADHGADCGGLSPLVINDVRWAVDGFPTDRGRLQMSA